MKKIPISLGGESIILTFRDFNRLCQFAIEHNVKDHGNTVQGSWIPSLKKRLWGQFKMHLHNKHQEIENA